LPTVHVREDITIAAMEAMSLVALTTLYNHRELTHQSLKLKPVLRTLARTAMWGIGMKPRIWADVHLDHHGYPDANIGPINETADFLEWAEANPERIDQKIPEFFPAGVLDPDADLTLADVKEIGAANREKFEGRYTRPTDYSKYDIARLLDAALPRYFYPDKPKRGEEPSQEVESIPEDSIRHLFPEMCDPHSPVLHKDGILGVLLHNVSLYKKRAKYHEEHENDPGRNGVPADKLDEVVFDKTKLGVAAFFAGNIAIKYALNWSRGERSLKLAVAEGTAITLMAMGGLVVGGNITNALGHGGASIIKGLLGGKPPVKPDGTYTSDFALLSAPTFDEVGGQAKHHLRPWLRAYSFAKGAKKLIEAPFGTAVDNLAERSILMDKGNQFGHPEVELSTGLSDDDSENRFIRPDEPTRAVILLQKARAITYERKRAEGILPQKKEPVIRRLGRQFVKLVQTA
jgi:hypothetical protein